MECFATLGTSAAQSELLEAYNTFNDKLKTFREGRALQMQNSFHEDTILLECSRGNPKARARKGKGFGSGKHSSSGKGSSIHVGKDLPAKSQDPLNTRVVLFAGQKTMSKAESLFELSSHPLHFDSLYGHRGH